MRGMLTLTTPGTFPLTDQFPTGATGANVKVTLIGGCGGGGGGGYGATPNDLVAGGGGGGGGGCIIFYTTMDLLTGISVVVGAGGTGGTGGSHINTTGATGGCGTDTKFIQPSSSPPHPLPASAGGGGGGGGYEAPAMGSTGSPYPEGGHPGGIFSLGHSGTMGDPNPFQGGGETGGIGFIISGGYGGSVGALPHVFSVPYMAGRGGFGGYQSSGPGNNGAPGAAIFEWYMLTPYYGT